MFDSVSIIDNEGREAFIMPLQLTGPQIDDFVDVLEKQIDRYKKLADSCWDNVYRLTDDMGNDLPGYDTSFAVQSAKKYGHICDTLEAILRQVRF